VSRAMKLDGSAVPALAGVLTSGSPACSRSEGVVTGAAAPATDDCEVVSAGIPACGANTLAGTIVSIQLTKISPSLGDDSSLSANSAISAAGAAASPPAPLAEAAGSSGAMSVRNLMRSAEAASVVTKAAAGAAGAPAAPFAACCCLRFSSCTSGSWVGAPSAGVGRTAGNTPESKLWKSAGAAPAAVVLAALLGAAGVGHAGASVSTVLALIMVYLSFL